jgi:RNA polymerase sigma-70 factor, ECF subfamily
LRHGGNAFVEGFGSDTSGSTSPTLIRRVKARDQDSWTRLYYLYMPLVRHFLRAVPEQEREDLAQEVFKTAFERIDVFEKRFHGPSFRGWLQKIAFYKVGNFRKKNRKRQEPKSKCQSAVPQGLPGDADISEMKLLARQVQEMIRLKCEATTYEAARQRIVEGRAAWEVAAALGITTSAVNIAKSRVLKRVRDVLVELGELNVGSGSKASSSESES